jgi:hypothetical protein
MVDGHVVELFEARILVKDCLVRLLFGRVRFDGAFDVDSQSLGENRIGRGGRDAFLLG